ncbi:MAG: hypothetical protein EAZ21_12860 [Betaproteobacteria bacterium]|nr:MAG: hypothetical protein EAZ21_12860 [Betaproteobacteria bacterium]
MLVNLRESLLALQERDLSIRADLEADGSLFMGYHPRMEAVHRENARQLRTLIDQFGWPHAGIAGEDGAEAAWLIAQHAIAEPAFMRSCRELLASEIASGRVLEWQYAYLDDRIKVFEGKPQRFGTQLEVTPTGPMVCEVEEPEFLNQRREKAGLEPLERRLAAFATSPRPSVEDYQARKAQEAAWRIEVGWSTDSDI